MYKYLRFEFLSKNIYMAENLWQAINLESTSNFTNVK